MPLQPGVFPPALLALAATVSAPALPTQRIANESAIRSDLQRILTAANLPGDLIDFELTAAPENAATVACGQGRVVLRIRATPTEWAPTLYHALQKLGFLFPHPRIQISPSEAEVLRTCGQNHHWRPRVRYRGFHFHTKHPNEWVAGFLSGERAIAEDTIRWLARNSQNTAEFKLLRSRGRTMPPHFRELVDFAHHLGIHFGVVASFAQIQQKSYYLITPWKAVTGVGDTEAIERNLTQIVNAADLDWITINLGHSEFTPAPFERTLEWIETANQTLSARNVKLFNTIHVSIGQTHPEYGEFNFLPRLADPSVGILPHTVMFYGLTDEHAPVYDRKNYNDLARLIAEEAPKRDVWYYPETSYFVGMDIDIPLLLTDYLRARSADFDHLDQSGIDGVITFTSGQELGYWLLDWTVALLANSEHRGNEAIGLELLGEDPKVWRPILEFQTKHFKRRQLISTLSSSNFLDETSWFWRGRIHQRSLLSELACSRYRLAHEIRRLEEAIAETPPIDGVNNPELKTALQVTFNRLRHALLLRQALAERAPPEAAAKLRTATLHLTEQAAARFNRYPKARLFEQGQNLTSYNFGYAWPARTLHFWEREEEQIRHHNWSPFFRNIYSLTDLVF